MDTSRIELAANRATALAVAHRYNASTLVASNLFGPWMRVGYRGDQWAIGTAGALTSNGFVVLAEVA